MIYNWADSLAEGYFPPLEDETSDLSPQRLKSLQFALHQAITTRRGMILTGRECIEMHIYSTFHLSLCSKGRMELYVLMNQAWLLIYYTLCVVIMALALMIAWTLHMAWRMTGATDVWLVSKNLRG
jgi:hypothetical protein